MWEFGRSSVHTVLAPPGAAFAAAVHSTLCRSDAGNTAPCVAGDAIRWWKDLVSGIWFEQPTSGARLIYRVDGNGKPYAEAGAGRFHTFGWIPTLGANGTAITCGAAVKSLGATNKGAFLNVGNLVSGFSLGIGNTTFVDSGTNLLGLLNAIAWQVTGVSFATGTRYISEQSVSSGTTIGNYIIDGSQIYNQIAGSAIVQPAAGISIGYSGDSTARTLQSGRIYGVAAYASASAGNRSALDAWLAGRM